ncbi:MAG: ROK family protein [Firmicutes bacterium]|nr:ROK family protein [Bacillota bacterium]
MPGKLFAAVDLGGTKIYTIIADAKGEVLSRKRLPTPPAADAESLLNALLTSITSSLAEINRSTGHLAAAGICVPGFFDRKQRLVLKLPNIPRVNHFPLESALSHRLGVPVLVENDANAAAVGEASRGAGKGHRNLIYITVSTGIGAGFIFNGELYRGSRGFAGEFGHMQIKPDGPLCGCGKKGCLEAVASGSAIARQANEALKSGRETKLSALAAQNGGKVTAEHVFLAAQAKDRTAQNIIEEAVYYLGLGISNLINLLNPSVVVLGGGVTNAGDLFFAPLLKIVAKHTVEYAAQTVKITPAVLGSEAGAIGMLHLLTNLLN